MSLKDSAGTISAPHPANSSGRFPYQQGVARFTWIGTYLGLVALPKDHLPKVVLMLSSVTMIIVVQQDHPQGMKAGLK